MINKVIKHATRIQVLPGDVVRPRFVPTHADWPALQPVPEGRVNRGADLECASALEDQSRK
jgi:hypothetical protein